MKGLPEKLRGRARDLLAALRRLEGTEGRRVARKNARQRVLAALRSMRMAVDAGWLSIRKERPQSGDDAPARQVPVELAMKRYAAKMQVRGYACIRGAGVRLAILEGGVRVLHPPKRLQQHVWCYAPKWAVLAASGAERDPEGARRRVAEARKSTRVRKAILAAARLGHGQAG